MTRLRTLVAPARWPLALLLLAANLVRFVPPDSRDAYALVAMGIVLLLALRLFFHDHEKREDEKQDARELAAEKRERVREERLEAQDRGVEAVKDRVLSDLAGLRRDHGARLDRAEDKAREQDEALAGIGVRLATVERRVGVVR